MERNEQKSEFDFFNQKKAIFIKKYTPEHERIAQNHFRTLLTTRTIPTTLYPGATEANGWNNARKWGNKNTTKSNKNEEKIRRSRKKCGK